MIRTGAAAAGLAIDALVGEPPTLVHPVAWFGRAMEGVETRTYRDEVAPGVGHLLLGCLVAGAVGLGAQRVAGRSATTAAAVALCSAGRMLDAEALVVADLLEAGDLAAARSRVGGLVGRATESLDPSDVARAAIESVAENQVDAVIATLWWAAIGGAPAALVHRAVNTLDAMVGHRSPRYERFGKATARVDDLLNYLPARLTAAAVIGTRPRRASHIVSTIRRDAKLHPSPNGGVIEAAFAAALGVRLGGTNHYGTVAEDRGTLGDGRAPDAADIRAAVVLRRQATAAAVVLLAGIEVVLAQLRRRSR